MAQPQSEKRSTRRFSLELPVKLVDSDRAVKTAQTRDVSSRGVYIYPDSEIAEGVAHGICDDPAYRDHVLRSDSSAMRRTCLARGKESVIARASRSPLNGTIL